MENFIFNGMEFKTLQQLVNYLQLTEEEITQLPETYTIQVLVPTVITKNDFLLLKTQN